MNQEIENKRVKVLPLLLEQCDLPGFLKGKFYADFTVAENYTHSLKKILRKLQLSSSPITSRQVSQSKATTSGIQEGKQQHHHKRSVSDHKTQDYLLSDAVKGPLFDWCLDLLESEDDKKTAKQMRMMSNVWDLCDWFVFLMCLVFGPPVLCLWIAWIASIC